MREKHDKRVVITVYSPKSQLATPKSLMIRMWSDLLACRELAWRLTIRDISARYRQSVLGILWAFIPPVLTSFIFIVLNNEGAIRIPQMNVPYPVFVIVGTVLWQLFVDSLNAPLRVVTSNKAMLVKVNFPREALILTAVAQVLFDFGIRAIILVAVFLIYGVSLSWSLLLAAFAVAMLMFLGIMIGTILTPLGILYTDINNALVTFTGIWFFVTPVVYPVPEKWPYSILINLNPVSPLLVTSRDLILGTPSGNHAAFIAVSALTLAGLLVMWVFYRVSIPIIAERIDSG